MAIYYCEECDRMKDGDWSPCVEHPQDPTACICEECAARLEENEDE